MQTLVHPPITHSLAYALDFLREQLADVDDADMVAQPEGLVNHPAWIVGHLTFACQLLGGAVGLAPWLTDDWAVRFGPGSVPLADARLYETRDEALARLDEARARITRAVEQLDEARLDEPFPVEAYRHVFPTIRHALTQVLVGHTAYHVGQLVAWRRAMGLPRPARPFE